MNIDVAIIMGSKSDWDIMSHSANILTQFNIAHESKVISAHRTPALLDEYCSEAQQKGVKIFITGAGLAAALPGVVAAKTTLPVIGVPLEASSLEGMDALLSIVQMPPGIPVGTMTIGKAGAINAALYAAAILALQDENIRAGLQSYRDEQAQKIIDTNLE
ncbi:MAG TPA: 5-(carboxyamino)imidazole ribonucleotide mutase [Cytophagales bacterium]|nr:5-(carboxyamino)imidazole ribonucleotide mutase [Cytophagales bacterium]